jgi:hypothetical protein
MKDVQDDKYYGCLTPKSILNFTIRFFLLLQEKRITKMKFEITMALRALLVLKPGLKTKIAELIKGRQRKVN